MKGKKYHITLNERVYEVEIEEIVERNSNKVENNTKPINMKDEVVSQPENNNQESITAPMPGTIVNVLVRENEKVQKGQVIAILEAMKMENEIVAPQSGTIKSINVAKGQSVNLGDNLLQII